MKTYTVIVRDEVFADMDLLADYIISLSTAEQLKRIRACLYRKYGLWNIWLK